jgi:hypothetical protein
VDRNPANFWQFPADSPDQLVVWAHGQGLINSDTASMLVKNTHVL